MRLFLCSVLRGTVVSVIKYVQCTVLSLWRLHEDRGEYYVIDIRTSWKYWLSLFRMRLITSIRFKKIINRKPYTNKIVSENVLSIETSWGGSTQTQIKKKLSLIDHSHRGMESHCRFPRTSVSLQERYHREISKKASSLDLARFAGRVPKVFHWS